jgi:exosortase
VGPAIIGCQAAVGRGSAVVRSVLWDGAEVGAECEILESIVDRDTSIPNRAVVAEQTVSARAGATSRHFAGEAMGRDNADHIGRLAELVRTPLEVARARLPFLAGLGPRHLVYSLGTAIVLAAFLWCYWPTFSDLWVVWHRSDEYSAGLLVPFLTVYILWARRRDLARVPVCPAVIGGVVAFLLAQTFRGLGVFLLYRSAERLSVILSVAALVLLLCGWRLLLKLGPVLLFLCLMMPWPNRVQSAITLPLQHYATKSAVFGLELAGYDVLQDGNIIKIGETSVAVAEACNGLRMITAFFVISGLVVLLAKRTWWEKLLVLVSSLPIALLCNSLRLTVTAIFFTILNREDVEKMFHDFGGFAMMPLALAMVVGELWLLARLTTPPVETAPSVVARRRPRHVPDA